MILQELNFLTKLYFKWCFIFPAFQEHAGRGKKYHNFWYKLYRCLFRTVAATGAIAFTVFATFSLYFLTGFKTRLILGSVRALSCLIFILIGILVLGIYFILTPEFEKANLLHHLVSVDKYLTGENIYTLYAFWTIRKFLILNQNFRYILGNERKTRENMAEIVPAQILEFPCTHIFSYTFICCIYASSLLAAYNSTIWSWLWNA